MRKPKFFYYLLAFFRKLFGVGKKVPPALLITTSAADRKLEVSDDLKQRFNYLQQHLKSELRSSGSKILVSDIPENEVTDILRYIGANTQHHLYKVNLRRLGDQYIGETEKNLADVFSTAKNKQWILFFDEADALFGKRTEVKDAHDKYANQEVNYLLQRLEDFQGQVVVHCDTPECAAYFTHKGFMHIGPAAVDSE